MSGAIVGGALLPHAPQFFTQPATEDPATIARVQAIGAEIGRRLRAERPDVWVMISNDHVEQFFQQCAPPFTFHVGDRATGKYAGRAFDFKVDSELAFRLVRELYKTGFDPAYSSTAVIDYAMGIPLTHLGVTGETLLPIFINAYLPPQPTMERCYAVGRALGRALEPIRRGNLRSLLAYDEQELDDNGNIELRTWAIAAGALGERKPDIVQFDPSWHHNYASIAFFGAPAAATTARPHYPQITPEVVRLTDALHAICHDEAAARRFIADRDAYAAAAEVVGDQTRMLVTLDVKGIAGAGVHPLLGFLADMRVKQILRDTRG